MESVGKRRLMVCAKGIEAWVSALSDLADQGDQEAERALLKLRDAFEAASDALGQGRELREDEFYHVREELLILQEAFEGRSGLSRDLLQRIAKQTVEDCRRLGIDPPDVSFLFEEEG